MPFKKKSTLSLNKRSKPKKRTFASPLHSTKKRSCTISSPSSSKRKYNSPLSTNKKRQKQSKLLASYPSSDFFLHEHPDLYIAQRIIKSPVNSPFQNSKRKLNFTKEETHDAKDDTLDSDVNETINLLKRSVANGTFSTNNIGYKIFKDTLKWYSTENISGMRYSDETKEFFWTGQRLLGGQFLRYMRGFAHKGVLSQHLSEKGFYSPGDSSINFPVPSDRCLNQFKPQEDITNSSPGVMSANVSLYANNNSEKSNVIMFDGKKIIPESADVDLLEQEEEPKYSVMKDLFVNREKEIMHLVEQLEEMQNDNICIKDMQNECVSTVTIIRGLGETIMALRKIQAKKRMYFQTLERKFTDTNDAKFKFAMNKVKTSQYQLNICVIDILSVIDNLSLFCSRMNEVESIFKKQICDLTKQQNYRELKDPLEVRQACSIPDESPVPCHVLKQRTPEWFELRKEVKVTGSVAHKALGMDSLASKREFFDQVVGGKDAPNFTDMQTTAMQHGTVNEINAVSTLVGKIMPVLYPEYTFYEEGAYPLKSSNGKQIMIISPDGCLRDDKGNTVSVEIKCPYPFHVSQTPVFYEVKKRHILQCLLESRVLNSDHHLYISWSRESTTVYKLQPDNEIVNSVLEEIDNVYYNDVPKMSSRLSESLKELKTKVENVSKSAEFVGEFPSIVATESNRAVNVDMVPCAYYMPTSDLSDLDPIAKNLHLGDVIQTLYRARKHTSEAYNFLKPRASEVLVYLLSDMDRTWKKEIGHGLPIGYLFKGYSLTMGTSRRILDIMLNSCFKSGIHVPCTTFDGQFARLKDYDVSEEPLTLFAIQRKFWADVMKLTKTELIHQISNCYKDPHFFKVNDIDIVCETDIVLQPGHFVLENKQNVLPVKTPICCLRPQTKVKKTSELQNDIQLVEEITGLDSDVVDVIIETLVDSTENEPDESEEPELNDNSVNEKPQRCDMSSERLDLLHSDFDILHKTLCSGNRKEKWTDKSVCDIEEMFKSADKMNKEMIGQELHEVVNFLNIKLRANNLTPLKQSLRKAEKVNKISFILGNNSEVPVPTKKLRKVKINSLASLCTTVLNKQTYPKMALAVAYAEITWPIKKKQWFDKSSIVQDITLEKNGEVEEAEVFNSVYAPEYVAEREQLEVRVMDGTHIRTNLKSKLIRTGLGGMTVEPWKNVAFSGKTFLSPAMLEAPKDGKIIYQQSDPHVRTMFNEDVEIELYANGYHKEASFCKLFRDWHEAEDMAGFSAWERVQRSLKLKSWLLDGYSFGRFPPPTQYIKGIPRVTFEGLICSIDAHVLLYAMCKGGSYNWRTVSTLVAENFMGELAERSANNHGVPSGATLPQEMSKISELHAMRLKPNRSFAMMTAKSRSYELQTDLLNEHELKNDCGECPVITNQNMKISKITIRNHEFDIRKPKKGRIGKMTNINQMPKGVQPVRYHYKVDETKILPSLRLGVPEKELFETTFK